MKITIVMGFFLPVPPAAGGATEKSWHRLTQEFARLGHEVTVISRRWPGWPAHEKRDGVTHLRLGGFAHRPKLWQNLFFDFVWSLRVHRALPPADLVIVNAVSLPCWLGRLKPAAGRVVVMPGRVPKGQFKLYRRLARILAVSTPVRDAVLVENPTFAPSIRVFGYPIDHALLATPARVATAADNEVVLGFIGRIHREKGLDLLASALELLARRSCAPWRVEFCGPVTVAAGGSGPEYRDALAQRLSALPIRTSVEEPIFNDAALAERYRRLDVFCYPSLAAQGETFGVAVAEAMAAGAVPVVSDLPCFRDFVRHEVNGLVFDHTAPDAALRLADVLERLINDAALRRALANQATDDVRIYDFPVFARRLLADFSSLVSPLDLTTPAV